MKRSIFTAIITLLFAAPFSANAARVLKIQLRPTSDFTANCFHGGSQEKSRVRFQELANFPNEGYRIGHIEVELCLKSFGYRKMNSILALPSELFDSNRMRNLRPGEIIETPGLPRVAFVGNSFSLDESANITTKIEKAGASNPSLRAITVTWLGSNPESPPLRLELASDTELLSSIPGFQKGDLPWKLFRMIYPNSALGHPLGLHGTLYSVGAN